jgi:RNA polymerase subunit RPABC4/transcription elongation factor Spt4
MTQETKAEIAKMYSDKSNKAQDIAKLYGISGSQLSSIAKEFGIPPRRKPNNSRIKRCPQCHSGVNVTGALFCPYCGSDIRTEDEKLIDRVVWLLSIIHKVGIKDQDKAKCVLSDVLEKLRKEVIK